LLRPLLLLLLVVVVLLLLRQGCQAVLLLPPLLDAFSCAGGRSQHHAGPAAGIIAEACSCMPWQAASRAACTTTGLHLCSVIAGE
jgi:hypothetical protein